MKPNKIPANARLVHKGVIFDVYQWEQEMYDGSMATFEMLKRPDTAGIIAIVEDKIVVLKDEQPHRGLKLTFPNGKVEPGEDWLTGAKRELKEETGMVFKDWKLVYVQDNIPRMEYANVFFIAQNLLEHGEQHTDVGEKIEVELWDFDRVKDMAMNNTEEYLRFSKPIFEKVNSLEDLLNLPEIQ